MSLALIIRPASNPPIHVLEVDGPRRSGRLQRGEGSYYLSTCNHPICDPIGHYDIPPDSRLKDWCQPSWEIYQLHDGTIKIHACRPTHQEAMRGDLHGRWGSVITIRQGPTRLSLRYGLRLARVLCKCIPTEGIFLSDYWRLFVAEIETDIPIYSKENSTRNGTAA